MVAAALTVALLTSACSGSTAAGSSSTASGGSSATSAGASSRTEPSTPTGTTARTLGPAAATTTTTGSAGHGTVNDVVPARTQSTRPAVPLSTPAAFGGGVTVRLSSVADVRVRAHKPGEFSGSALKLTFTVRNASGSPIDLSGFVANVTDSTGAPATPVTSPPARQFGATLPAGHIATGVSVFTVAPSKRRPITVSASYTAAAPVVLFRGDTK